MILVMDVGNSNLVLGIYEQEQLLHHWRLTTDLEGTSDEYGMKLATLFQLAGLSWTAIDGVIISSVVPPLLPVLEQMCRSYLRLQPMIVGPGIKTGLNIRYENPRDVGADRIVNAVAAIRLYGPPLILVDFGTATTFEYINEKGEYLGGAICPGIAISMEALYRSAAKLPRIEYVGIQPKSVLGRNPVTSIQSGILFGYAGQVDGIVQRIREEFQTDAQVIATGELADSIASQSRTISCVNPHLTLEGLNGLYRMNQP